MKHIIRSIAVILALILIAGSFILPVSEQAIAASKPAKPVIYVSRGASGKSITITIAATERAEGYLIYMKSETDETFRKIKTLKKDGTEVRSYTVKKLEEGRYRFRVKAYCKKGKKTVKSSYSKIKNITLSTDEDAPVSGDVLINETNFPDSAFRTHVEKKIDTDGNGILTEKERNAVKKIEIVNWPQNLDGIGFFPNLEELDCGWNENLTSLDVSKNPALKILQCYDTSLTELDVSKNLALEELNCSQNGLTVLDVSSNTALKSLRCSYNKLTGLDLTANTALKELFCSDNQLTSLDVSNCDPEITVEADRNVEIIR